MPQSTTTMTIPLEPELKPRLDKLSAATHRSKSFLAAEAVRGFLEINEGQIEEIKNALKEADAEDFSSENEIRSVLNKWGVGGD